MPDCAVVHSRWLTFFLLFKNSFGSCAVTITRHLATVIARFTTRRLFVFISFEIVPFVLAVDCVINILLTAAQKGLNWSDQTARRCAAPEFSGTVYSTGARPRRGARPLMHLWWLCMSRDGSLPPRSEGSYLVAFW